MVHADSAKFDASSSKEEIYQQILAAAEALFIDQDNWVCNLANSASLLWHGLKTLPEPYSAINWAGFYVLDQRDKEQLILGPFHGKVACQVIKIGKGVCGVAAQCQETQLVQDVEQFPGHIACDSETKSEIVVPIIHKGRTVGVIDIDCEHLKGFDLVDQKYLEKFAQVLSTSCKWN